MPHSKKLCYEFGPFFLNADQRVLLRAGRPVALTPKATDILLLLLKHAGQLVGKEEVMSAVWPDAFVEEGNVTQNVFKLRRALGDKRDGPRFIETVSGRGYRFVGTVRAVACSENGSTGFDSSAQGTTLDAIADFSSPPKLAVLPFVNATGNPELEYLADGITDNLTNNLSRISKLRIMSRSGMFRYRHLEGDPGEIGRALGVDAILNGKIQQPPSGLAVSAELMTVNTGWQLWGDSFDLADKNLLEIQDEIARQITSTLRLHLTGDEEKKITTRYTQSSAAYEAYLEGRYHWSKYSRAGIEKAIVHFRRAIELDPNYALAYSGIVDCYLRLATNYLPPADDLSSNSGGEESLLEVLNNDSQARYCDEKVKLRNEWDWKAAERELRRANELKLHFPTANQWHAAYAMARALFLQPHKPISIPNQEASPSVVDPTPATSDIILPTQIRSISLTLEERIQICCAVAREQIEAGNFVAASQVLSSWWHVGQWPRVAEMNSCTGADLLFTTGLLAGCLASAQQLPSGQKHCEALLNGSLALFEQLRSAYCAIEVRLELATCYYRQGLFDLARKTISQALQEMDQGHRDLRGLGLVRLGIVERHAGRLQESYKVLKSMAEIAQTAGPWVSSRFNQELAITLRDLGIGEQRGDYVDEAKEKFLRALQEFDAIGNHRYAAVVENNYAGLLLSLKKFREAEIHLVMARNRFDQLEDLVRKAQVDDTLAQLYIMTNRLFEAEQAADRSVETLDAGDEQALLAESLTTKGLILCKQRRFSEAKGLLESAHRISKHCGDSLGACRALLVIAEEMIDQLDERELKALAGRLSKLLRGSHQTSTRGRLQKCLSLIGDRTHDT